MMEFIKKAGLTFWFGVAAGVLALVGMILLAVTNSTAGYAVINGGLAIAMSVIAILFVAGGTFTAMKFGATHYLTAIIRLVALVLLLVSFAVIISDRVGLMADLFTWDSHNELGWSVLYTSITSMVFTLLSVVVLIIGSFFNNKKAQLL